MASRNFSWKKFESQPDQTRRMEYYFSSLTLPNLKAKLKALEPDRKTTGLRKQDLIDAIIASLTKNQEDDAELAWLADEELARLRVET